MSLQRSTETCRAALILPLLIALLAMAGCADLGLTKSPTAGRQSPGPATARASRGMLRSIPSDVLTMFERATAAMAAGDFAEAEFGFKELVLLYPEYPGAYVNLAIIHANNENDAATRAAIDAALALDAKHPAALNQLGMLLRRNGKFPEAEAAYLKAVTVSPDYALAHYNLGVLYELYLQRLDAALQQFEAYQSLVGEDKQVAKWITDLRRRVAREQRTASVVDG